MFIYLTNNIVTALATLTKLLGRLVVYDHYLFKSTCHGQGRKDLICNLAWLMCETFDRLNWCKSCYSWNIYVRLLWRNTYSLSAYLVWQGLFCVVLSSQVVFRLVLSYLSCLYIILVMVPFVWDTVALRLILISADSWWTFWNRITKLGMLKVQEITVISLKCSLVRHIIILSRPTGINVVCRFIISTYQLQNCTYFNLMLFLSFKSTRALHYTAHWSLVS